MTPAQVMLAAAILLGGPALVFVASLVSRPLRPWWVLGTVILSAPAILFIRGAGYVDLTTAIICVVCIGALLGQLLTRWPWVERLPGRPGHRLKQRDRDYPFNQLDSDDRSSRD